MINFLIIYFLFVTKYCSKSSSKSNKSSSEVEPEASDDNNEDECESYVLTLSQKPEKMYEDDSSESEENVNSSQCFEECSQVLFL